MNDVIGALGSFAALFIIWRHTIRIEKLERESREMRRSLCIEGDAK